MRRADLLVQEIENAEPGTLVAAYVRQLFDTAFFLYRAAHRAYQQGQRLQAAEYAAATKDVMRAIDKLYNIFLWGRNGTL